MSARGVLPGGERRAASAGWLAGIKMEWLALVAFIGTILLLGYWHPIPVEWFAPSWKLSSQYDLVSVYTIRFEIIVLYPSDIAAAATIAIPAVGSRRRQRHSAGARVLALRPTLYHAAIARAGRCLPRSAPRRLCCLILSRNGAAPGVAGSARHCHHQPAPAVVGGCGPAGAAASTKRRPQPLASAGAVDLHGSGAAGLGQDTVASDPGASVVQLPDGARWLRAYGSFPIPISSAALCLALPVVTGAYLRQGWRTMQAWLLLLALALGTLALFLSFSRAAWLGILISALWAGVLLWLRRRATTSAHKVAAQGVPPGNLPSKLKRGAKGFRGIWESEKPTSWPWP